MSYFDKLSEECGIFGVATQNKEAAGITYNGLLTLQHRGQEGAGISVLNRHTITTVKNLGLVSEVFTQKTLQKLASNLAIGHCRYSTQDKNNATHVQPFVSEYLTGRLACAYNGSLINANKIKQELDEQHVDFFSGSGGEIIAALAAIRITQSKDVIKGLCQALAELEGAFSVVFLSSEGILAAARDPRGYRPLCIGKSEHGYMIASESCAIEAAGYEFVRDIKNGEVVMIKDGRIIFEGAYGEPKKSSLCIFEYVYFARPDSVIDGMSVYESRYNMGMALAQECPVEADVVCGAPDSGIEAAMGYAAGSGLPFVPCFVKNRYMGRSFIYPTQSQREHVVRVKLNPLRANVEGKRIVLIDDSIVRGTTCVHMIRALREAGAKEVHMRVSSPPFVHTCYYGTDIGDVNNLIARKHKVEDIAQIIGVDSLGFISCQGLKQACKNCNLEFCTGCFTGHEEQ